MERENPRRSKAKTKIAAEKTRRKLKLRKHLLLELC
jgi:hypothetical protein